MTRLMPRPIKPELIEPGDRIEVAYDEVNGLTVIHRGTVGTIESKGVNRHLVSEEGAIIGTWSPSKSVRASFTLISRSYGGELLDMFAREGRL